MPTPLHITLPLALNKKDGGRNRKGLKKLHPHGNIATFWTTGRAQKADFRFQSNITENAMDYAYFSFANPGLKEKNLKLVVAFDHKTFRLKVWIFGFNRTAQRRWAEYLSACSSPMELTQDPNHTDFVVRLPMGWLLAFSLSMGFPGIYLGQALSPILPVLVGLIYFKSTVWERKPSVP